MKAAPSLKAPGRSHKVIEKRRRDRINQCLTDLTKAVPSVRTKQSCGKLEKAEILEMTVDYIKSFSRPGHFSNNGTIRVAEVVRGNGPDGKLYDYNTGYAECIQEVERFCVNKFGYHGNVPHSLLRLVHHLQSSFNERRQEARMQMFPADSSGANSTRPTFSSTLPLQAVLLDITSRIQPYAHDLYRPIHLRL